MKSYTLREAWQYIDKHYPVVNVYDTYILREDYTIALDNTNARYVLQKELINIEISFGITRLEEKIKLLQEKIKAITLPYFGWKYNIPEEIEKEVKEEHRRTIKQIKEIEQKIEELLDTIQVEEDILHFKKLT